MLSNPQLVYDFTPDSDIRLWSILDDAVMGGVSAGNIALTEEGHARYFGEVSLDNNGGFSSVRYNAERFNVEGATKVLLRIKGDGTSYQFRLKEYRTDYHSYTITFPTTGKWETVELNLNDMYPTFRGSTLNMPNFEAPSFQEMAFFVANKRAEKFELLIDKVELE